jgi:BirA family transcriptional regulator, biotin operon repressor / biotin---[acetyl-CoA-carboxylase] ligase
MKPLSSKARMTPEAVLKGLKTRVLGRSLLCLEKTTSTNDVILELARQGALEGTTVTADIQTQGRGRQGRKWTQTQGKGLAFSLLLRPKLHSDELPEITLAAAVAVAKTVESFRLKPQIKWPNDLLLGGRKVCGILTEMGTKKDKMASVVLGIGVNLNQTTQDFPRELRGIATSFYRFSGRKVDRARFLQVLLGHLEETYHWVGERRFSKVLAEWRKRAVTLGRQVKVTQAHHVFYGQVMDIDEKGALLVRKDSGIVERVTSGDVEVVPVKPRKRLS